MSPRKIAVILGAGPGLGASLAKSLIPTHSLVLLSRSLPSSLPRLGKEVSSLPSDRLLALSSDGSKDSLSKAFDEVKRKWPDGKFDLGIYNVGGFFVYGDFLDGKEEDFLQGLQNGVIGAYNFSQLILPLLLNNEPDKSTGGRGNLIFTGATMAIRGGAKFSTLSPGMFARRSLSQSLAREFGPKGVHVSHVVIDGVIDTPGAVERGGENDGSRLDPDDIAKTYLALINQPKTTWTQELDIRPSVEKW